MNIRELDTETKTMMFHIYWDEIDKWGRENKKSTVGYSTYELLVDNVSGDILEYYHRLATIELRKQKLNKIWKKIQV